MNFSKLLMRLSAVAGIGILCSAAWGADGPSASASRSSDNPESFRLEVTGAAWLLNTGGSIQASGSPIDLVHDLGAQQGQATFFGKLVVKPGRRHRIVLEGTPFSIKGTNTVQRTVSYHGQNFTVSQTLQSSADLQYFYGGYQYDALSGSLGHLGFSVGAAYLNASGAITAVQIGTTASTTQKLAIPLAGTEFRIFPIRGHRLIEVDGDVKGIALGDYGYYIEGMGQGGVSLGPLTFLAGYRATNIDLHQTNSAHDGLNARFRGPIFSVMARW